MIALVLTIVVMLILAGITIQVGSGTTEEARMISFVSRMQLLQKKIDFLAENGGYEDLGETLDENMIDKLKTIASDENIQIKVLPSEYRQVEYIEGTGTQWIDTEYIPKNNTIINVDFMSTKQVGETYTTLFGSQKSTSTAGRGYILFGTTNNLQVNIPRNETKYAGLNNDGAFTENGINTTETFWTQSRAIYTLDIPNVQIRVDNNTWDLASYFSEDFVSPENKVYVFTRNTGGTADSNCSKGRLYGVTIYEDDELVKEYIPCYCIADNMQGMYDLIDNRFYPNKGSGNFTLGPEISSTNETTHSTKIPSAYQEVMFLESTGTQYFNLGIIPKEYSSMEADFLSKKHAGEAFQVVFGTTKNEGGLSYTFSLAIYSNNRDIVAAIRDSSSASTATVSLSSDTFINSRRIYSFNENTHSISVGENSASFTGTIDTATRLYPLLLLARNNSGVADNFAIGNLYGASFSDSTGQSLNLVPCYRKIDNKPGLYDLVGNQFFTNQGSGEFNIGPIVENNNLSAINRCNKVKYFNSQAIAEDLGIDNIDDEIIVDFGTRQIVSLNGIEYEGEKYYSQYNLPGGQKVKQTTTNIRELEDVSVTPNINGINATFTISGIDLANGTLSYSRNNQETWTEITNYTIAGEDVITDNITKSGTYHFKWTDNTDKNNEYLLDIVKLRLANSPRLRGVLEDLSPTYNYSSLDSTTWAYATDKNGTPDDATDDIIYVWIPRFAYEEDDPTNIEFLRGTSNVTTSETYLPEEGWIIPDALKDVTGVWINISSPALTANQAGLDIIDIFANANATILD